jgi:hypothetical protein
MEQGSHTRKQLEIERTAAEVACTGCREAYSQAHRRAEIAQASLSELTRTRQRLEDCRQRCVSLRMRRGEWQAQKHITVREAEQSLSDAQKACEAAKHDSEEQSRCATENKGVALRAAEVADKAYEDAFERAVQMKKALDSARSRRLKYAELQADPKCPLCLQGIDEHKHKTNVDDMVEEEAALEITMQQAEDERQKASDARDSARKVLKDCESALMNALTSCKEHGVRAEMHVIKMTEALQRVREEGFAEEAVLIQAMNLLAACENDVACLGREIWKTLGVLPDQAQVKTFQDNGSQENNADVSKATEDGEQLGMEPVSDHNDETLQAAVRNAETVASSLHAALVHAERARDEATRKASAHENQTEAQCTDLKGRLLASRERAKQAEMRLVQAQKMNVSMCEVKASLEREMSFKNPNDDLLARCKDAMNTGVTRVAELKSK